MGEDQTGATVEEIGRREPTVGFVGAGNMAEALIKGLLAPGKLKPERLAASDPRRDRVDELRRRYAIHATTHNEDLVRRSRVVVLAVKPQIVTTVCDEISPWLKPDAVVISIAAGVPLDVLEAHLPPRSRLVRAIPNMPALVGSGVTALAPGRHATAEDLDTAMRIADAVGATVIVQEAELDGVTGLSGSGPAYVFMIIEALADAGVKMGLARDTAVTLAARTVEGAARLLIETGEHPGRLKDRVASPGGTTIAALHILEAGGLRATLIDAVEAATRRSRELGAAARGASPEDGPR